MISNLIMIKSYWSLPEEGRDGQSTELRIMRKEMKKNRLIPLILCFLSVTCDTSISQKPSLLASLNASGVDAACQEMDIDFQEVFAPMYKSDDWPWESWYTDGNIPVIHHVHYTRKNSSTTGIWAEGPGAPQRPPEIFGHIWYWYDDPEMIPALSK